MGGVEVDELIDNVAADATHGMSRRQVLRAGAAVGVGLVWVAPVVSGIGMSAANAATTSGGGNPPGGGGNPPGGGGNPPGGGGNPPGGDGDVPVSNVVEPTKSHDVLGINFEQPPPAGVTPPKSTPTATLPFTGAAVPVTGAVALGAGLVATGVAAVAATRRHQGAAAGATDATSTDPELPAV